MAADVIMLELKIFQFQLSINKEFELHTDLSESSWLHCRITLWTWVCHQL